MAAKRGPYSKSLKRREQIAQVVLELVDEIGHEELTTAMVAERSGVPETSVLYHFPSRDHLLVAALQRADELELLATGGSDDSAELRLEDLREPDSPSSNRARLYSLVRGLAATPGHPAADYLADRLAHSVRIFTRLIAVRQARGDAHPGLDPGEVAMQVVALWEGLTLLKAGDPDLSVLSLLRPGIRRLTGQNWMEATARLGGPDIGL